MKFFALSCLLLASVAIAQIPIPRRYDGFGQGAVDSPILLEAFLDFLCPDSLQAFANLKGVISHYNNATASNIRYVVHGFPLPYHHNSFFATQAAHAIAATHGSDSKEVFTFIQAVYDNIDTFSGDLDTTTPADVKQLYANLATKVGLDSSIVTKGFANGLLNFNTRVSWKYGCSRAVSGTPTFFVNGVNVAADASWTIDQWKVVLDPLLAPAFQFSTVVLNDYVSATDNTTCPADQTRCEYLPGKVMCCHSDKYCIPNVGCTC